MAPLGTVCLLLLLGLLLRLFLLFLLLLLLGQTVGAAGLALLFRLPSLLLLLLDPLDSWIYTESDVDDLPETGDVLLLSACTFRLVLLLGVTFVITAAKGELALCQMLTDYIRTYRNLH